MPKFKQRLRYAERQEARFRGSLQLEAERVILMRRQLIAQGVKAECISAEVKLSVSPWERRRQEDLADGIRSRPNRQRAR